MTESPKHTCKNRHLPSVALLIFVRAQVYKDILIRQDIPMAQEPVKGQSWRPLECAAFGQPRPGDLALTAHKGKRKAILAIYPWLSHELLSPLIPPEFLVAIDSDKTILLLSGRCPIYVCPSINLSLNFIFLSSGNQVHGIIQWITQHLNIWILWGAKCISFYRCWKV